MLSFELPDLTPEEQERAEVNEEIREGLMTELSSYPDASFR